MKPRPDYIVQYRLFAMLTWIAWYRGQRTKSTQEWKEQHCGDVLVDRLSAVSRVLELAPGKCEGCGTAANRCITIVFIDKF